MQCRSLRGFDAVVAVSTALASRLSSAGVHRERIHIVPNAFGRLTPFAPSQDARETLGVTGDAFHIGWIGRLGREKGADVLLEAISRIAERNFVVSVIGDGRERRALESLAAQRGLGDRVKFHGLVREAARLMPAFDLFVLSSRTEGTPIVLFEAMAAGVPVIATRVGGVPDVLGDEHALLVPPEQPDLLASAIAAVLRGGAGAARRASRARERLASRYALAPWLERYEAIYRGAQRSSAAA
jgi:glycosyltransferase involved in cell wall biosynthesis